MERSDRKTQTLLTVLQGIAVVVAVLGVLLTMWMLMVMVVWLGIAVMDTTNSASALVNVLFVLFTALAVLGGCAGLCRALWLFFGMCGRLKRARAFTEENGAALRGMARALGFGAGLLAGCGAVAAVCLFLLRSQSAGLTLAILKDVMSFFALCFASAFLMLGIAPAAAVLRELLMRAMALQQEQDETV